MCSWHFCLWFWFFLLTWKQLNKHSVSTHWLSVVLNVTCKLFFLAIAQVQLHVSPGLRSCFCLLNSDTHVVVFTSILLYTPVTSLPDTSDDITLQQRMTAFILFTGCSLQKRPQPPINLFSTLGWAVHTLCVALIKSGCFYLYLTLEVSLSDLEAICHVAVDLSLLLSPHTAATFTCSARWPCCLPRNPLASFPCGDDFHPPSHISHLDHTVTARSTSAFICSSAKCWFRWSIMKPVWG